MAAPVGNEFWKARAKHGRDKIFSSHEMLWDAACEYFEWVADNPLTEYKVQLHQGEPVQMELPKMRAMTIGGLCRFLHINPVTWGEYRKMDDFSSITGEIDEIIREQKLTGAAADLLNANIIARDLGLKDASTSELTGKGGGPIILAELSDDELVAEIAKYGLEQ